MYRIKHIPSGLYYQPHKHRGNNLSKTGKIYARISYAKSAFKSAIGDITLTKGSQVWKICEDKDLFFEQKQYSFSTPVMTVPSGEQNWKIEKITHEK